LAYESAVVDPRLLQFGLLATALGPAILAIGFLTDASWATNTWPFPATRLTNLFLASILIAIVAPTLWISATREWGALRASALFPALMSAGMAVYVLVEDSAEDAGLFAAVMGLTAVFALMLAFLGSRAELQDQRRVPTIVRASFALFAIVLLASGGMLVAGKDNVLPWNVTEETGVMVGIVFLGAASSYLFGFLRPAWGYAYPPLLGFLAYDLVLLGPLIDHFADVVPEQENSLIIYVAALTYSGLLAAYYFFVNRETRLW
jgi:MFS family permease